MPTVGSVCVFVCAVCTCAVKVAINSWRLVTVAKGAEGVFFPTHETSAAVVQLMFAVEIRIDLSLCPATTVRGESEEAHGVCVCLRVYVLLRHRIRIVGWAN